MTRPRATTHRRRRSRERWGVVAAFVLAALGGLLAAHLGTHHSWENPPARATTSVPAAQGRP